MTDADDPQDSDLVPVMVPRRHLQKAYTYIGQLMVEELLEEHGSTPISAFLIDADQGTWTEDEVDALVVKISGTTLGKIVWQIVEAAPSWITYGEVVEQSGFEKNMVRAQLGSLTKYCREITGRKSWPFTAEWRGSEMAYRMRSDVAEAWMQSELVLVEMEEEQRREQARREQPPRPRRVMRRG